MLKRQFTAVYKKDGRFYIGWIEEVPGVNTQGRTLKKLKENLKEALLLVLETNKMLSKKEISGKLSREPISVSF
ncbi:MAG: type II toxin-antitoxin system HicB family antitoxin [bacterium]|nr:type II toxin-antitoxin system HicB family antitoxin [bacterium]